MVTKNSQESGQTTMEFALTLMLLMAFILFFVQLSLVFAYGNFVHYATFMAARSYLSAGPSREDQVQRATDTIVAMLKKSAGEPGVDRFPVIAKGLTQNAGAGVTGSTDVTGLEIDPPSQYDPLNQDYSWLQGVRYTFRSRVFMIPLAGGVPAQRGSSSLNSVTLTSESWLGNETPDDKCRAEMDNVYRGFFDNGC